MAVPLENPGDVAMRSTGEPGATRSPLVEFAWKKSVDHVSFPDSSRQSPDEMAQPWLPDLPKILLPRDSTKPLITAASRYSKGALEAYKGLRARLLKSQANHEFRSVAVTSVGRSEGKTLTAFNLAFCCAQVENFTVLLIDSDLRTKSLTRLIGKLPPVGLADVMSGRASCEEAIVKTDEPNLYVMGAGSSDVPAPELFSTEKWSQVIRWSRSHFKMVLVDVLSIGAFADFELTAPECDGILVVVRARNTSREDLKMAVDQLDPAKLIGIVWNGDLSEGAGQIYS
jgi:capsular exopolysaccharide synthesis family protein